MTGFLIPPWYKDEVPGTAEMNIASIIFGFSLGSAIFTASKAATQSFAAYKRGRLFSAYIVMCWLEWIGCNCMGIVTYIWLKGIIEPRLVSLSRRSPKEPASLSQIVCLHEFAPFSFWVFFFISK